ncbi:hypothetical protein [Haloarchaeobius sp. TZWWS8]|uniref:hypothetical protein n=1 Tax=Haloarchaeobius sp. TZWWS8 TaxID=3446121 RepID=UPI003EB917C4
MTWRCDHCAETSRAPPCDDCGGDAGAYERFVWRCRDCETQHNRNNPPCTRCGGMTLDQQTPDYSHLDAELAGSSYLDHAKPALLPLAILAILGALLFSGVVSVPTPLMDALDGPTVSDAPGHADEANGLDLEAVEAAVHQRVADHRESEGLAELGTSSDLDRAAEFENQKRVVDTYEGGSVSGSVEDFSLGCNSPASLIISGSRSPDGLATTVDEFESEDQLATSIYAALVFDAGTRGAIESADQSYAVDVHVGPDGSIWVVHAVC